MTELILNEAHYTRLIREEIPEAKRFLWIATADLKDLHVAGPGKRFVPFVSVLATLVRAGVEVRLVHAKEPGPRFRADFDRYPELIESENFERVLCPRMHAKVVIVDGVLAYLGSANLTAAGYRHNIELAMVADLGPACLFPNPVLTALADELASYLDLVPGLTPDVPARQQAARLLQQFRARISAQKTQRTGVLVAYAPSNDGARPLDALPQVWSGAHPLKATQVSAFWDADDPTVLAAVSKLLTGRPAADRRHRVAVTIGPAGEISFPRDRRTQVDEVVELGPLDTNIRTLHAKALVFQSSQWIAALIGSSNHTIAGLGLGKGSARRHRELNVWMGASLGSKEGKALRNLIPCGKEVSLDAGYEAPEDEDEPDHVATLPPFFQLCRLSKTGDTWQLHLTFDGSIPPKEWRVSLPNGKVLLDSHAWGASDRGTSFVQPIDPEQLPMFLDVTWEGSQATWVVVADDRHDLPPGLGLSDLPSAQLLDALATGKTVARVLREKLERDAIASTTGVPTGIVTDPLKRFDSRSSLLRRGRALASALAVLEARLARPITTLDALDARLSGPLGPLFIADRLVTELREGAQPRAETLFTLAEIALSISRVPWVQAMQYINMAEGMARVRNVLEALDDHRIRIGPDPVDLAQYAARAIKEAKACINF